MPEFKPSILKDRDIPKLRGAHTKSQSEKAASYDKLRPGTNIPEGQKAHRFELMQHRAENGAVNRRRQTSASSIRIPRTADIWNDDGTMKP